jgi:aryl-alcohol dehydrogenase-like predicted oxidoreductase
MLGAASKEQVFKLLDEYYELGGNFIDSALLPRQIPRSR